MDKKMTSMVPIVRLHPTPSQPFKAGPNNGEAQVRSFALSVILRLRPALIRASRVLPSTPALFQSVERHFFEGQFGGFPVSGIHRCPHTSHTATLIVVQPMPPL
jgi:hypothetical protein